VGMNKLDVQCTQINRPNEENEEMKDQ